MKVILYSVSILLMISSCFEPPELPDEPRISFNNIRFTKVDGGADSLVLTLNFEDGDGDIGLDASDVFPPYHSFNYVVEEVDGQLRIILFGDTTWSEPLLLAAPIGDGEGLIQGEYEINGELPPYSCEDYLIIQSSDTVDNDFLDTVLIEKNIYNKNIYVDFYRKVRGEYFLINNDFSQGACVEFFNSRFPIFDEDNIGLTLTGSISFSMLSQGFETVFRNDSIKLEFFIYDRALNKSNVAETNDFVLASITSN